MVVEQEREQDEGMAQFINQYADTPLKFDMLCFWSRYPEVTFSLTTIARFLNCPRRVHVEEALAFFEKAELVDRVSRQGLNFYRLTTDPDRRGYIIKLSVYRQRHCKRQVG